MRSLITLFLGLLLSVSVQASIITYDLSTQTFPGSDQQVNGSFTYNSSTDVLEALSVHFFGTDFDIYYSLDDVGVDAFAFESNNNSVFGDDTFEGFELFKDGVYLTTGRYLLGRDDTCFEPESASSPTCNQGLFTISVAGSASAVTAPGIFTLTFLACAFCIARSRKNFIA